MKDRYWVCNDGWIWTVRSSGHTNYSNFPQKPTKIAGDRLFVLNGYTDEVLSVLNSCNNEVLSEHILWDSLAELAEAIERHPRFFTEGAVASLNDLAEEIDRQTELAEGYHQGRIHDQTILDGIELASDQEYVASHMAKTIEKEIDSEILREIKPPEGRGQAAYAKGVGWVSVFQSFEEPFDEESGVAPYDHEPKRLWMAKSFDSLEFVKIEASDFSLPITEPISQEDQLRVALLRRSIAQALWIDSANTRPHISMVIEDFKRQIDKILNEEKP